MVKINVLFTCFVVFEEQMYSMVASHMMPFRMHPHDVIYYQTSFKICT
jgi:E3 ubiquitin-protein ligase DOA10